ncbi:hypothetical protein ACEUZ9_000927 [Paracoccus litorisediminis]|uniref:hypothetical protein n=1 Tax=Paracoccus litorisediminis TaxID=2006130 RepID=UPI003730631B
MVTKAQSQLRDDIRRSIRNSPHLLFSIDLLREVGISTLPRVKPTMGLIGLRFQRGDVSMTRSEAGIGIHWGSNSYSVTHHDPVMRHLEMMHARGLPQPRLLDEAGEMIPEIYNPHPEKVPSLQFLGRLQTVVEMGDDCPDAYLRGLGFGHDAWCDLGEEQLRKDLGDPVVEGIEALEELHRIAAIRWSCRIQAIANQGYGLGDPQELALRRQHAILRHLGKEPEPAAESAGFEP